jgi:hypothetical protein
MLGENRRDLTMKRQMVIAANPELRERELAKLADYAKAIIEVLHERGVKEPSATFAAEAGTSVLRVALESWSSGADDRELIEVMRNAVSELRAVAAGD